MSLALAALLFATSASGGPLRDGDIVFHTSRSAQSRAVQAATRSPWSHMGLVFSFKGKLCVLEAVQPVKITPLDTWLSRGEGGRHVVKRLKDADTTLTEERLLAMRRVGESFLKRPYDLTFEWSDARIYCSELVYKVYQRGAGVELAPLAKLRDFDLDTPAVKAKLKERYGSRIPLDEPVISPDAIFRSPLLVTVRDVR